MQDAPARLSELPSYLIYILFNPAFNPKAAFLLYATIGLFLLLILVAGIFILTRPSRRVGASQVQHPSRREEFERLAVGEPFEGLDPEESAGTDLNVSPPRREGAASRRMGPGGRLAVAVVTILVLGAVWAVAGYTTSDPALCKNCHWPASEHAKATAQTDPHTNVPCISCHESGGTIGRYLTGVPARLIHFADSQSSIPQVDYGRVTRSACSSCHRMALDGVATNKRRALKVSHKEPLAAAATCIDCHALLAGVVGPHNVGMTPCLRCHDAKRASARCATCHDEKAASAARARTTSFAAVQIPNVSCGGCHDEKRECDSCHGTRLPHSAEFKAYAHARSAAVDFWYNGGRMCSRCHTASRRPCQQCHGRLLGGGHGTGMTWLARGHQAASADACDTCHRQFAHTATRDFCRDVCHTPAARAASPR